MRHLLLPLLQLRTLHQLLLLLLLSGLLWSCQQQRQRLWSCCLDLHSRQQQQTVCSHAAA
jgi:hypothetical protein